MRRQLLGAGLIAAAACLSLTVGACGSPSAPVPDAAGSGSGDAEIAVVTSTNVYADIAQAIGGDAVRVTSIISDPQQDPHSYQANTQVALELSKAQLVIENGGGYDDFVDTMLATTKNTPTVLNAVAISGLEAPAGGELNEHVWYSFAGMRKVAARIAVELGRVDPRRAPTFTANAQKFDAGVDQLIRSEAALKDRYGGEGVGITEPVPLYLLDAVGLINKTPEAFSAGVEEGEDVSAAVLQQTLDLYTTGEVKVLVYNEQTSGPITDEVKAAAQRALVPVVAVSETLPQGQTYLSWMRANVTALGAALGRR